MIFVTVGNSNIGFDRLIRKMDEIAPRLLYPVFAQIGNTKYIPKNIKYARFLTYNETLEYIKTSKVVVTHAGAGTLLDILVFGKKPIVVPRLKKFGEHIDDHQLEITQALEVQGLIYAVYDINDLEKIIFRAIGELRNSKKIQKIRPSRMVRILSELIGGMLL
ncbi:PssE/Cps14G family polysaccharide biosynthesis glycosyltransferase [Thermococcus sp. 2319x1]|uniref:PssE/Cps14G family polysaccharide biosynthesis glycosyltransferase n=1 Tax=Thermococcus sp. 2319x1 TaxID=1674923 RepID=UPI00158245D8|nr:PssE/Cps14G family polysaccharide biosynthesis glycosyltransferase [Thermococcus sp. 2319x1]